MSYIRPYPFHDITSGSMKPPVMPYAKNNNKPTKLAHNLYGKVLDGMADIHRPVKKEVAHMGGTVLRSFNDTPLQFPLSRNVPHLKRGNYAEIQSILDKSRDEQAKIKSNPDYHLQMKALEAKGYINMGMNADNEKENALRERLSASGASAEEIEKILKDARIEKFKKDLNMPLNDYHTVASVASKTKPPIVEPKRYHALPFPAFLGPILRKHPGKTQALISRMNGFSESKKRDNRKAEAFAPGHESIHADFTMNPRRRRVID